MSGSCQSKMKRGRILWLFVLMFGTSYFVASVVKVGTIHADTGGTIYSVTDCSAFAGTPVASTSPTTGAPPKAPVSAAPGSLQDALNFANNVNTSTVTINFNCIGNSPATITIPATIQITKNITLQRQTGQSVTLDGGSAVQLFVVNYSNTFTLRGLTIANSVGNGGNATATPIAVASPSSRSSIKPHAGKIANIAEGDAGAIYSSGGTVVSSNNTYKGNSAISGGAIYSNGGSVYTSNDVYSLNSAVSGGAIYSNGSTVTSTYNIYYGNSATSGGAIYGNGGTVVSTNDTFMGNAAVNGSAIYSNGSTVNSNSDIYNDNSSPNSRGVIAHRAGSVKISGGTFTHRSSVDRLVLHIINSQGQLPLHGAP